MVAHRYLRAYLAGVFVPTLILPLFLTAFVVIRLVFQIPVPIERVIIFPTALLPVAWGLWNALWLGSHTRTHLGLGPHGAILAILVVPFGAVVAGHLGILAFDATGVSKLGIHLPYALVAAGLCCFIAVYYLVWKYIVGFINGVLGIAP